VTATGYSVSSTLDRSVDGSADLQDGPQRAPSQEPAHASANGSRAQVAARARRENIHGPPHWALTKWPSLMEISHGFRRGILHKGDSSSGSVDLRAAAGTRTRNATVRLQVGIRVRAPKMRPPSAQLRVATIEAPRFKQRVKRRALSCEACSVNASYARRSKLLSSANSMRARECGGQGGNFMDAARRPYRTRRRRHKLPSRLPPWCRKRRC